MVSLAWRNNIMWAAARHFVTFPQYLVRGFWGAIAPAAQQHGQAEP